MWNSGFFNALLTDTGYDRTYNADDYSNALSMIVGNGVVNALNGTSFKVELVGTPSATRYSLLIMQGWAWINGKWVRNDTSDTTSQAGSYTLDSIPMCAKNMRRIDRLILRLDDTVGGRDILPVLLVGTELYNATAPSVDRTNSLCIAEIHLDYTTDTPVVNVYDKRADKNLCGWVNGYFGDNWEQYCATITEVVNNFIEGKTGEFNRWFGGVRDEVASVTLLKPLINTVNVSTAGDTFEIGVTEYNPTIDILQVFTNGIFEKEGEDYTIDATNKTVTFTEIKSVGAVIDFVVTKAVDGRFYENADAELIADVEERLTSCENWRDEHTKFIESITYITTGEDDNIKLCDFIRYVLEYDMASRHNIAIKVISHKHGFKISQPYYTGNQSSLEEYNRYFDFSIDGTTNRRFILDFSNCSPIEIDIPNNTNNIIFYGANQEIRDMVLKAGDPSDTGTKLVCVYGSNDIHFVNCKFGFACASSIEFAYHGKYDDCEITLTSQNGNATAFYPSDGNIVEVNGGIYFLYTTESAVSNGFETKFIYQSLKGANTTTAVSICRDVSIPNYARSGYVQSGKLYHTAGGYLRADNVISPSTRTNSISSTNNEIRGAIPLNRPKGQSPYV